MPFTTQRQEFWSSPSKSPRNSFGSTVTASAEERIGVIEQRIMTRDNLLAIANKFQMFPKWRNKVSQTDLVDLMRERTAITPVALNIGRRTPNSAVAFTVSFEYEEPEVTMKVANELVTLILNEDIRTRTARAAETTKFLAQETDKLEQERLAIEAQIDALKQASDDGGNSSSIESQLAALKSELLQKSSIYSDTHPTVLGLKKQIAALEQVASNPPAPPSSNASPQQATSGSKEPTSGAVTAPDATKPVQAGTTLSILESKQEGLQKDLDIARQKLLAARQGERLEADQQSERFEVIEQPAMPQAPVKPNRKKTIMFSLALAVAAGLGGVFAIKSYDKTMRGPADLPVPKQLVVTIPYLSTKAEINRARRVRRFALGAFLVSLVIGLVLIHFLVLPLDLVLEKVLMRLGI